MEPQNANEKKGFSSQIAEKEKRKLKFQKQDKRSAWTGLGLFGIVGWSVVVPALLGTALGIWLDRNYPQTFSWTISFLLTGLATGCMVAWNWIDKENKEINQDNDE